MPGAPIVVLAWTLAAAGAQVAPGPAGAGATPPSAPTDVPGEPEPPPSPPEGSETPPLAPPPATGWSLGFLAGVGTAKSDVDRWQGYGGSAVLDLWGDDPPSWATRYALRLGLEGGSYGGAASIGILCSFGDGAVRPYVVGTLGLGVFASMPGAPLTAGVGAELVLPWRLSLLVEGRAGVATWEDLDEQTHWFGVASAHAGVAVRL